jgi:SAM-dependent methyltransferase
LIEKHFGIDGKTMTNNSNHLPILYHAHHQHYQEDIPFWKSLARNHGNPILELGCGTGRVLLPLAKSGHNIFGIDNSPEMVRFLNQQISPELQSDIFIIKGDMISFNIEMHFQLIFSPCNTYSTVEAYRRPAMLSCIYDHLAPGGVFGVSIPNPKMLAALAESASEPEIETIFNHPVTGYPVQVSSCWKRNVSVLTFIWHYDHLFPNGQVERITTSTDHALSSKDQYLREMLAVNFSIQSIYGNFDLKPFTQDSTDLIILVQKQK